MGMSAFGIVIVPVLWGTLDGLVVGTVVLTLMNAIEWLVTRGSRANRSAEAIPRPLREALRQTRRQSHRAIKV